MSLRAALKVPKYGLFYFDCDWMLSVVPLSKIARVISGDNVSKGNRVMLKYGPDVLEAKAKAGGGDAATTRKKKEPELV